MELSFFVRCERHGTATPIRLGPRVSDGEYRQAPPPDQVCATCRAERLSDKNAPDVRKISNPRFASVEDMPERLRDAWERKLAAQTAAGRPAPGTAEEDAALRVMDERRAAAIEDDHESVADRAHRRSAALRRDERSRARNTRGARWYG